MPRRMIKHIWGDLMTERVTFILKYGWINKMFLQQKGHFTHSGQRGWCFWAPLWLYLCTCLVTCVYSWPACLPWPPILCLSLFGLICVLEPFASVKRVFVIHIQSCLVPLRVSSCPSLPVTALNAVTLTVKCLCLRPIINIMAIICLPDRDFEVNENSIRVFAKRRQCRGQLDVGMQYLIMGKDDSTTDSSGKLV